MQTGIPFVRKNFQRLKKGNDFGGISRLSQIPGGNQCGIRIKGGRFSTVQLPLSLTAIEQKKGQRLPNG